MFLLLSSSNYHHFWDIAILKVEKVVNYFVFIAVECLGSYSSVVGGGALHHAPPMLTPSLVNYVRSDLTGHVTGWPADILEKQVSQ